MNPEEISVREWTVAADGSGDYATIQQAVDAIPAAWLGRTVLHIRPGIYREKLRIEKPRVTLRGGDAAATVVTWGDGARKPWPGGGRYGTFRSFTAHIGGDDFTAEQITFENTAGSGEKAGQAVAAAVLGDRAAFYGCRFLGRQDTLFAGPLPPREIEPGGFIGPDADKPRRDSRQYYRECLIRGDVDFIFGSATAVFDRCQIESCRRPAGEAGYVTAASTPQGKKFGFVFLDCGLAGDALPGSCYLGRPWRDFARTVFIRCRMGAHIRPEGFHDWGKTAAAAHTVCFAESGSTGPGAGGKRAPFVRRLTEEETAGFEVGAVLSPPDGWHPEHGGPG